MNRQYIQGMNEIKADDALKREIIRRARQPRAVKSARFFTVGKAIAMAGAACALALALTFGIPLLHNGDADPGGRSLFGGFVITAYAHGEDGVEVKPNVEFILGKYSLTMSSAPGFPVKIACDGAQTIKLKVSGGELLTWSPDDSVVRPQGKEMEIQSGDTVYWSPVDSKNPGVVAETCSFVIEAYKDGKLLGSNTIGIVSDKNQTYTGILS